MTKEEEEEEYELKGELDELEAEFKEFEAEFGLAEEGLGPDELEAMSELEDEMDLAGITEFGEGVGEEVSFASLGMDDPEVQAFVGGWIKRKVRRLIQTLIRIVRRYGRRCAPCVRMLVQTIRLFRRRKYFSALRQAYRTYRCIRRCVR
jgi:hypothetical protein